MYFHGSISDEEYEDCYVEALLVLREKYDNVGIPYWRDGKRVCPIETLAADDHTIFLLAWGSKTTEEIESARRSLRAARAAGAG
jgi:hypothetical protein